MYVGIRQLSVRMSSEEEKELLQQLTQLREKHQQLILQYSEEFSLLTQQEADLAEELARKESLAIQLEAEVQQLEKTVATPTLKTPPKPTVAAAASSLPSQPAAATSLFAHVGMAVVEFDEGRSKVR